MAPELSNREFETLLFCEPKHLELQSNNPSLFFTLVDQEKDQIMALFSVKIVGEYAFSPEKAPYAGFCFSENLSLSTRNQFMGFCEDELRKRAIRSLTIKGMPMEEDFSQSQSSNYLMINRGYRLEKTDLHAFLPLDQEFSENLNANYKRRLRKSKESGFKFSRDRPEELEELYTFIVNCRNERQQKLSLSLDQLIEHVDILADKVHLYSVKDGKERVAGAIMLEVNDRILYDYAHAHPRSYDSYSPVLMLLEGVANYARSKSFNFVDLGSSSLGGTPNFPLLDFKRNLGSRFFSKLYLKKDL